MILYNKQITKALIRLQGCAGKSAPLLFASPKDQFSRVEAHMILKAMYAHSVLIRVILGIISADLIKGSAVAQW